MPEGGHAIHAYLDRESKLAWETFATDNGVSLTGLLDAMGRTLAKEIKDNGGEGTDLHLDWVRQARRIDATRRRRGRR